MDRHTFYWKVLCRAKIFSKKLCDYSNKMIAQKISSASAHRWQKQHAKAKGYSVINRDLKKNIKQYSKSRFGSESYWPWLAAYTEIREEFIEGWVPYDYYRFKLIDELNLDTFSRLSGMKTFDYRLFNKQIVKPVAICLRNRVYKADGKILSLESLIKQLKELNCELVIKPDEGSGGKNIQFVHSDNIRKHHVVTTGSVIIQKVVQQHHLLKRVNPTSVNTFRVLSYIDEEGNVTIKFVYLRFGTAGSRLDNISAGGRWIFIFPNGQSDDYSYNLEGFKMERVHPETNVEFSKLTFPFYNKIVQLCIDSHRKMPYAGLIGWDIFINESGTPMLIEWNAKNPFFWPVEALYGPFFKEEVV